MGRSSVETIEFTQCAALPYVRIGNRLLICLVTSRETGRWIVPKGWAKAGASGPAIAAEEAFEEAGIVGEVGSQALGFYEYRKKLHVFAYATCRVSVYALHADYQLRNWQEQHQRRLEWLEPREAARRVREAALAEMIIGFGLTGTTI